MGSKKFIEKEITSIEKRIIEEQMADSKDFNNIRVSFFKKMWEDSHKKREECRIYSETFDEYGVSIEDVVYLYKILKEKTVFGHYKGFKKKLSKIEYIQLIKNIELHYHKPDDKRNILKKINKNPIQYLLFDLEPYTIKKNTNNYIEEKAKTQLKKVAQDIWYWKRRIENEDDKKFVKSFNYASFTPDRISPYIVFDEKGRLKRGCKKYWNYLKKEVSNLSNVPLNQIIM